MTKEILCAAGVLFLLLIAGSPSAEFYKYVDEQGNVHFTDDFNKVPIDQREGVQGYTEVVTAPPEPAVDSTEESQAGDAATDDPSKYNFEQKMTELNERKAELTKEYEALMNENRLLKKMRPTIKTKEDAEKYNQLVRELNAKFEEHDQKRKAFYTEVENYNQRVADINKPNSDDNQGN